jgi:AcrR family transcriptional regulator
MLDAAESLFAAGGANAVTVEAVVQTAATSVGSFYARFTDREGLLAAMHARFLDRMQAEAAAAIAAAARQAPLAEAVAEFVGHTYRIAVRHRASILFFVATSATDTPLRNQGLAANPAFAAAFSAAVGPFRAEIAHAQPERAVDVAFRILFAMFVQRALFTPREATGRSLSEAAIAREITNCLVAYLRAPPGGRGPAKRPRA